MIDALRRNWPEYLIEGALLGTFMFSAAGFGTLLFHPDSPVARSVPPGWTRRVLMGVAMGGTAAALIYSPWGRRSGAHMNPATTATFWWLGRVGTADAVFYAVAQVVGGAAGLLLAAALLGASLAHPEVRHVVTVPGPWGRGAAFAAEAAIAFALMLAVLHLSNDRRFNRYTGAVAACLVAAFIVFESPVSGMSMNPARTAASAIPSGIWDAFWIYLLAPTGGMLSAAAVFVSRRGLASVLCAKLHHDSPARCIFRCRYGETGPAAPTSDPSRAR